MTQSRRGQSSIETALVVGIAVVVLVTMSVYLQRAYQGYLYSSSSGQGSQFDYAGRWEWNQRLGDFHQVTKITSIKVGPEAVLPPGSGNLPSIPGGQVPGSIFRTNVRTDSSWNVTREGRFEAR